MRRILSRGKTGSKGAQQLPALRKASKSLAAWFVGNHRDLPWRRELTGNSAAALLVERGFPADAHAPVPRRDPYQTWIAEIMLQQTQVASVVEHFNRWMLRFPNVQILAKAGENEVLEAWAGLGYYSRARNILATARSIAEDYAGRFPWRREQLLRLKGIGEYTAGAISSLAFNLPAPILDGNVARVFSRVHGLDYLPDSLERKRIYWDLARAWAESQDPGLVNEGLMELGALVCAPRNPRCGICPLARFCRACIENRQSSLPPSKPKKKVAFITGFAVVILQGGKVLLYRPRKPGFLAGLLTFPVLEASDLPGLSKAWRKKCPGFTLRSLRSKSGLIIHSITFRRFRLRMAEGRMASGSGLTGPPEGYVWIATSDLDKVLVSSLPRKIWKMFTGKFA